MQVRTCRRCNKLFKSENRIFCPACQKIEEEEFRQVRDYIRANKEAVLMEIVEATGVSQKKILDYIRKGRIEVQKEDFGVTLKCEICGNVVSKGMLCLDCYNKMIKPLREQVKEEKSELEEEMKEFFRRGGGISSEEDLDHIYFRHRDIKKEEPKK